MSSVCFYFQVHQPFRLRRYSFFNISHDHSYFDEEKNMQVMRKVAEKCYLPANELMLKLIDRHEGAFRIAYSLTGVAIEQMKRYTPEVLDSFKRLAATGCVEFLAETYYHSLASLYDQDEFRVQVHQHRELMRSEFGVEPKVFRNTELIYNDTIGQLATELGFTGVLAEGVDDVLQWRSPNYVYRVPGTETRLLLKNYRLSDDVAFRFSNREWKDYPLTPEKYATWIHSLTGASSTVNLFMDYETFGEHQWASTGIFDFMEALPEAILADDAWSFKTPSETISAAVEPEELSFPRLTSWADSDRDASAWNGNRIQHSSLKEVFALGAAVRTGRSGGPVGDMVDVWRKLQSSDHFYYMCTKPLGDGVVHSYFSPYESPYDAFINYQNVFRDFKNHYPSGDERHLLSA